MKKDILTVQLGPDGVINCAMPEEIVGRSNAFYPSKSFIRALRNELKEYPKLIKMVNKGEFGLKMMSAIEKEEDKED